MKKCWKRAYSTEQEARAVLGSLWRKPSRDEVDVYRCARCGGWHLTSVEVAHTINNGCAPDDLARRR